MSGFAHPCPDCGCEEDDCSGICSSGTPATITIAVAISGITNISCSGNNCNSAYGGTTFTFELDLVVGHETVCYEGTGGGIVCGGPIVDLVASIEKPVGGTSTVTVSQQNGDLGAWTASFEMPVPVDCTAYGPETMTIDSVESPGGFDVCDSTGVSVDFSLVP